MSPRVGVFFIWVLYLCKFSQIVYLLLSSKCVLFCSVTTIDYYLGARPKLRSIDYYSFKHFISRKFIVTKLPKMSAIAIEKLLTHCLKYIFDFFFMSCRNLWRSTPPSLVWIIWENIKRSSSRSSVEVNSRGRQLSGLVRSLSISVYSALSDSARL